MAAEDIGTKNHLVGRLDVHVMVTDSATAHLLRPRLERLVWELMPRAIEQVFDASPADMILELGFLSVDLGTVGPVAIEEDALAALRVQLSDALAHALHRARQRESEDARLVSVQGSRLEQLNAFLQSGVLPYPNRAEGFDLARQIKHQAGDDSLALIAMLRKLATNRRALERLALQLDDDGLTMLLGVLAPADARLILGLLSDIISVHRRPAAAVLERISEPALSLLLWVTTLEFLLRDAGSQFNRRRFLAALIEREARRLMLGFDELLDLLGQAVSAASNRSPLDSSLPGVLAELLAERQLAIGHQAVATWRSTDAPRAGRASSEETDADQLVKVPDEVDRFDQLAATLDDHTFAALIKRLAPKDGLDVLAEFDALIALHRKQAFAAMSATALKRDLWALTIGYLSERNGSDRDHRLMWRTILRATLAATAGGHALRDRLARLADVVVTDTSTFADFAFADEHAGGKTGTDDIDRWRTMGRADNGIAVDRAEQLLALLEAGASGTDVVRVGGGVSDDVFEMLLDMLAVADAASLSAALAQLMALHRSEPLFGLPTQTLAAEVRAALIDALIAARGHADRRQAAWRAVIRRLAMVADQPSTAVVQALRGRLRDTGIPTRDASGSRPSGRDRRTRRATIDHFLRTGQPAAQGAALVLAFEADRAWLAGRMTVLIRQESLDPYDIAERLLDWLTPNEIIALVAPARSYGILKAMRGAGGADREAWRTVLIALLRGEDVPAAIGTGVSPIGRADRLAGLAGWLDTGQSMTIGIYRPSTDELLALDSAELNSLLLGDDERDTLSRISIVLGAMAVDEGERLLARFAPWVVRNNGPLAALYRSSDRRTRTAILSRAAAAALAGAPVDLAGLTVPLDEDVTGSGSQTSRRDREIALVAWFDAGEASTVGVAPPSATDLLALDSTTLVRLLQGRNEPDTSTRISTVIGMMTQGEGERLLMRLVARVSDNQHALLSSVYRNGDRDVRGAILSRAVRAARDGVPIDLAGLPDPVTLHMAPALRPPAPISDVRHDRGRLLFWLDGKDVSAGEGEALAAMFARLVDARDAGLVAHIAARRSSAAARARWVLILPAPALTRILHLLVPAEARTLIDSVLHLTTAWRQIAPFGARRPSPQEVWRALLDNAVEPKRIAVAKVIDSLVKTITGDHAERSAALRDRAAKLARDAGYATLAVTFKRMPAPTPPRSAVKEAQSLTGKPEEPTHALYVGNAGLVLLNPFLHTFFERLGLMMADEDGKPFIPADDAASRAVHLLQYCADGRLDRSEPELILNKLLCGLPSYAPIARAIMPTELELEICDDLMAAVIANWPMLSDMTADALRETFFQREGRLRHAGEKWLLQVQRKTLDVLLDPLPWSFSLVYHRWMTDPIHVTW